MSVDTTQRPKRRTSALPRMQVARVTLPGEIYSRMKAMILDGGLIPGELVTIQGLASAFGVSAMPVREALQRLTAEGALRVISGRSVGIPELESHRLIDLTRVRVEIESLAASWATPRMSEADSTRLQTLVEAMTKAVEAGDTRAYVRANHDFHFTIYAASGSATLLGVIEALWLQVSPYFHLLHGVRGTGNYDNANHEHTLILKAVRAGDADACAAHLRADIESATAGLLRLLK
jgi:DNA-binding GntR family transcriptional regulator